MVRTRIVKMSLVALACALFVPSAWAQQTLSGLSGMVKDAAGVPVAGATVEAASPALIERVRSVVTDGSGQYKITDLQPGVYAVTVKAPGFGTLTQAGVDLPAAFVGTVNADLKPGNPNEVVTVTATTSLGLPGLRSAFTVPTKAAGRSTPAWVRVPKPGALTVTAYTPGCRSVILYWPDPSVTTERTRSISAGLAASTVAPATGTPAASLTMPDRPLSVCWAHALGTNNAHARATRLIFTILVRTIVPPENHRVNEGRSITNQDRHPS